MSICGSGGMESGSANAERPNEFKVVEEQSVMESVTPFDRFGLEEEDYRDWPRKLAENLDMPYEQPAVDPDYKRLPPLSPLHSPVKLDPRAVHDPHQHPSTYEKGM